jgi:hypothetical protein
MTILGPGKDMLCPAHKKRAGVRRERKSEKTPALKMHHRLYIKVALLSIPFPPKKCSLQHKNNQWISLSVSATKEAVGAWLGQDRPSVCQPGRRKVQPGGILADENQQRFLI